MRSIVSTSGTSKGRPASAHDQSHLLIRFRPPVRPESMARAKAKVRVSVATEFEGAELGDRRLNARLERIARAADANPRDTFPDMMGSGAELEGFYRFVRNEKVSFDEVLQPHVSATVRRVAEHGEVIVIHDTTEFRFLGDKRQGLGRVGIAGQGFMGHFSLAVVPGEEREPLGVLAVEPWTRRGDSVSKREKDGRITGKEARTAPERESLRWARGISAAEDVVAQRAALIHVMDSEADDYALLTQLIGDDRRFVVRMARDRAITEAEGKVRAAGASAATVATRSVALSRRKPPIGPKDRRRLARAEWLATLTVGARQLSITRPSYAGSKFPKSLQVNVIYVNEVDVPKGTEPVEWILFTTEPVKTKKQILRVVDIYRSRWLIEEYFKALKTGCDIEKRQLESCSTLLVALGVFVPIAWGLLRLRALQNGARYPGESSPHTNSAPPAPAPPQSQDVVDRDRARSAARSRPPRRPPAQQRRSWLDRPRARIPSPVTAGDRLPVGSGKMRSIVSASGTSKGRPTSGTSKGRHEARPRCAGATDRAPFPPAAPNRPRTLGKGSARGPSGLRRRRGWAFRKQACEIVRAGRVPSPQS